MKMACGDPQLAFRVARSRPGPHPVAAGRRHRRGRFRCDRARGGDRGDEAPERGLDTLLARSVPPAEHQLRTRARPPRRRRGARRDAARRVLRGRGHRAIDAGGGSRVREPLDGALRHDARRGAGDTAAPRRAVERAGRGRSLPRARQRYGPARRRPERRRASGRTSRRNGQVGRVPRRSATTGVPERDLSALAEAAATQWTGTFNPRPFGAREALEVYQCAY